MTGIEYLLEFDSDARSITVYAENPTNRSQQAGIVISTDNRTMHSSDFRLSGGEVWNKTLQIEASLDALRDSHVVRVSTYGATRAFEFDYEIDPESSTTVPTPYIADTTVTRGTIDGEPSTVVNITVVNPSVQQYPTKLMVHTQGTDGSFYAAIVPTGESETVTVELLDDPETVVVGEARLYAGRLNRSSGGIDQVGFRGEVNGSTSTWNESYRAVEGPWSENPYRYDNASVGSDSVLPEQVESGPTVRGIPVVLLLAIAASVAGLLLVRRR
ncbi:hypothetical protein [Halomarina oriensis]|nr:hypothetical protein [Halomarina oriensis]